MRATWRDDHTARLSTFMVAGIVVVAAATHDAQGRRHGTLARGQDRAHQQQLGFPPSRIAKQRFEGSENGYNGIGQGEHD